MLPVHVFAALAPLGLPAPVCSTPTLPACTLPCVRCARRVGGRERYFHCKTCNCCYAVQLRGSHVCIENSMHHNCPVCFEFLFESIKPIHVMPCGHTLVGPVAAAAACALSTRSSPVHYSALPCPRPHPPCPTPCLALQHEACLQQLIDHRTFVCPVCSKTFM